ncbi:MAG: dTDP-4-dehydrorhamnose reductase [Bacteroidales bacterium]|nr:dTDP-4-dehydrorhamnose reductase [Bacteroidales bacterium]
MKILVTGANGQLGCTLRELVCGGSTKACVQRGEHVWYFSDVTRREGWPAYHLDITDPEDIGRFVHDEEIDAVVNCAAYTNVDAAEDNFALAERLNADAPGYLAEAMAAVGGLLVHISTDYVFGQEPYNTPCREDQQGTPTGVYGLTKLHGEQKILATGCRCLIFRTAWLYSEYGRNFVKTMLQLTREKPSLKVVFDQAGTPTYARDLAGALLDILESGRYAGHEGIYHFSNEGVCSWYDFALQTARFAGHDACDVQPCHSDEFPSKVKRPAYSVLDKTKVKTVFGLRIPHWTDSLKACVARLQTLENQ